MIADVIASRRNPVISQTEAIGVPLPSLAKGEYLTYALLASGFRRINDSKAGVATLIPCPVGTFSNYLTRGTDGCTECPAGKLCLSHPCSLVSSQTMERDVDCCHYTSIFIPCIYDKQGSWKIECM